MPFQILTLIAERIRHFRDAIAAHPPPMLAERYAEEIATLEKQQLTLCLDS